MHSASSIFIEKASAMLRMVFEIVMVLAVVLALVMITRVGALENKQIGNDNDESGDNNA
ncbi:MAG: hypothetical protein ACR65R_16560 [Methylomicrobium sp.]